jgi:hypothetical protein
MNTFGVPKYTVNMDKVISLISCVGMNHRIN